MLTIGELIENLKGMFSIFKEIFDFFKPLFGIKDDETTENA